MKTEKTNLIGFDITLNIASTLAEAVELAGSEQRILDYANRQILAHSHYGKLRRAIARLVERETGVRMAEGEKEREFIFRVKMEKGDDAISMLAAAVQEISDNFPVDYKGSVREEAKLRVPPKRWLAMVENLKAAGMYEKFIEKHGITFDGNETDEETIYIVADKIREIVRANERRARTDALASLA